MNISEEVIQKKTLITSKYNYKMLDIAKYIAAIMVICIHTSQLVPIEYYNFFIKNIICRVAVPFFFVCSAYFVRKNSIVDKNYVRVYLKKTIKSYCLWSIVFIPIGLDWIHQNLNLPGYLLPLALIYGLIHIGTYYHLWYLPAMILAIFLVDNLLKRFSYKVMFIIAILLFMFGSIESYYGLLQNGWFKDTFDLFISVISTTRSGIFYGMIFTLIGFYIYDYQEKLITFIKYIPILTLSFLVLLILEGNLLYHINRLDMNFLTMLIPFIFFLFIWVLVFPYTPKFDTKRIRNLSKYYYFIHPVCIVIVEEMTRGLGVDVLNYGFINLVLVIFFTHILSSFIITICYPLKKSFVLLSLFIGVLITIVIASIFFLVKSSEIAVKFELVPCLWFYSSFMTYYIVTKLSAVNLKKFKNN